MKINKKLLISFVCFFALFAFAVTPVFATLDGTKYGFGYATALDMGTRDLRESIMGVLNVLMGFLGTIAIVIILAGGFKYMTAMGSEDKTGEAKKLITSGVIGLAIILSSYTIAYFVVTSLTKATGAK
ncbi:MAG: hypothetical protein ABIC82_06560 [bacterium]